MLAVARSANDLAVVFRANEAFLELTGAPRIAVEGRAIQDAFRATAGRQVREAVEHCASDGAGVRLRIVQARGGVVARLEVDVRPTPAGDFILVSVTPLERRLHLSELGEAGVLSELGALSRGLVYIQDVPRGRTRYGRHPLIARLDLPPTGVTVAEVRTRVHVEDLPSFDGYLAGQIGAPDDRVATVTFRMSDAEGDWVWINVRSRVFTRDRTDQVHRVIGVATDVTELHAHSAAMAAAAEALAHAELNERRRIGRELHDSTSQHLLAARLALGRLERDGTSRPVDRSALEEARRAIAGAESEIRNFSYMLHPPALEREGLVRCVVNFAAGFSRRTGLMVDVKVGRKTPRLPHRLEIALYRIVQEALMNVYRHAGANSATVRLRMSDDAATLEVEDDGVGLPDGLDWSRGVGMSGMRARMTQLGGELTVARRRKGLLLRVRAPISQSAEA